MKRLGMLLVSAVLFGCGGSDAGSVFDGDGATADDSAATGDDTTSGGDGATDDTTPGGEDVLPPADSGGPPPPPPGDTGTPPTDSGPTVPDVVVPETPTTVACTEPGGKMYMGHCYFPLMPRGWFAARDFCVSLKAHLATITSAGEQAHVNSVGFNDRWIGLLRGEMTPPGAASFKWITGEPSSYSNWESGEPNGSGSCARLTSSGSDGRWADYSCSQTLGAVCERE